MRVNFLPSLEKNEGLDDPIQRLIEVMMFSGGLPCGADKIGKIRLLGTQAVMSIEWMQ